MIKFNNLKWLIISILIVIVDLYTKHIITSHFELYESKQILPIFNLTYVRNTGAAFSFLAKLDFAKHIFSLFAVIVSLVLCFWLIKLPITGKAILKLSYACIIGGAIGNLIDRIYNGYVVDFLDFYITISGTEWHYPIFNVADIAICMGAFLLIIEGLFFYKK